MTRSIWKGPFVEQSLFETKKKHSSKLKIWSRQSFILPQFIGFDVEVHTGKTFVSFLVTEDMVGHKFGEFAMTRKTPVHKKKEKRRK